MALASSCIWLHLQLSGICMQPQACQKRPFIVSIRLLHLHTLAYCRTAWQAPRSATCKASTHRSRAMDNQYSTAVSVSGWHQDRRALMAGLHRPTFTGGAHTVCHQNDQGLRLESLSALSRASTGITCRPTSISTRDKRHKACSERILRRQRQHVKATRSSVP